MQIQFLGTGPSSPIPRIYCDCQTCQDARQPDSYSKRLRSSILLTANNKHILFDATPDVLQQLERAKTYCVDAIFFTHAHNDAAGGFFDLNDLLLQQNYKAVIYVESSVWQRLRRNLGHTAPWLTLRLIKPYQKITVFGLPIVSFRVGHSVTPGFPTFGYRIGNKLVYASDIKTIPDQSKRLIKNIPHLILDGCTWFSKQLPSHLSIEQSIQIAHQLGANYLYPTQIGHRYPPYKLAQQGIDQYLRKNKIPVKTRLAYDGLKIKV